MYHYPLFETLALIDGKFNHIEFHQQRINRSFNDYLNKKCHLDLNDIIIPNQYKIGFFRCRIDYNETQFQINYFPYTPRKILTFHCVNTENLDYQFKYSNRNQLDSLNHFQTDEVIIINNHFVSDCTIGNLLFLKNQKWYSPKHYLLKGTQLSYLIAQKSIELIPIKKENLFEYEKIMVINALNPFDPNRAIPITPNTILY